MIQIGRYLPDDSGYQTNWPWGGMADVYPSQRFDSGWGERVAVKVLEPTTRRTPIAVARFQRGTWQMNHPHIVPNYGYRWRRSAVPSYGICGGLDLKALYQRTLSSLAQEAVRIIRTVQLCVWHCKGLFTLNTKYSLDSDGFQSFGLWDCGGLCRNKDLTQTNSVRFCSLSITLNTGAWFQGDHTEWYLCHGDYFFENVDRSYSLWRELVQLLLHCSI